MSSDDIIKEEIESIIEDVKQVYEESGKRVSGRFAEGLSAIFGDGNATIFGFLYLSGRDAGRLPVVENIEQWVVDRGLAAQGSKEATGIAWAVAKKIAREGTNDENEINPYEIVITPQRIDKIIERVSQFNVTEFVNEVRVGLRLIQTQFRN